QMAGNIDDGMEVGNRATGIEAEQVAAPRLRGRIQRLAQINQAKLAHFGYAHGSFLLEISMNGPVGTAGHAGAQRRCDGRAWTRQVGRPWPAHNRLSYPLPSDAPRECPCRWTCIPAARRGAQTRCGEFPPARP